MVHGNIWASVRYGWSIANKTPNEHNCEEAFVPAVCWLLLCTFSDKKKQNANVEPFEWGRPVCDRKNFLAVIIGIMGVSQMAVLRIIKNVGTNRKARLDYQAILHNHIALFIKWTPFSFSNGDFLRELFQMSTLIIIDGLCLERSVYHHQLGWESWILFWTWIKVIWNGK